MNLTMNDNLSPEALAKIEKIQITDLDDSNIIQSSLFSPEGESLLIQALRNSDIYRAISLEIGGRHFVC